MRQKSSSGLEWTATTRMKKISLSCGFNENDPSQTFVATTPQIKMLCQPNFSFYIFCDQVPILRLSGQHPGNLSCLYFGSAGSHTSKPSLVKTKTLLRQIVCGRALLRIEFRILRFSSKWTIHRNILSPENWVFLLDTIGAATDGSKPLQINKIWKCWIKESYWIITKNIKQIIKPQ